MQIAKSKRSSNLAGSCEVKHHVLAAMQTVAMPGSTKSRQGQVRYPLQLTRRNNYVCFVFLPVVFLQTTNHNKRLITQTSKIIA